MSPDPDRAKEPYLGRPSEKVTPCPSLALGSSWKCPFTTPGSSKPVLEETSQHRRLDPGAHPLYPSLSQGAVAVRRLHETSSVTIPTPSSVSVGRRTELSAPTLPKLPDDDAASGRPSGPAGCLLQTQSSQSLTFPLQTCHGEAFSHHKC